ncbi:hypothetical protein IV55_GL000685 [Furfurilactobacillus siliginis]|nr:hypothetical protein IV55_GL000685 [Furfurilactobacillus siliginis]
MYPELKFWGVEVNNPSYHGHIEGDDVYINILQDDLDWLKTALHEAAHHENDTGDMSNVHYIATLRAEKWAVMESKQKYKILFD